MTEQQRKKAENRILLLSIAALVLAAAYLIITGLTGHADTLWFPIGISVFLAVYWVISNILPVFWMKIFDGKTEEQKRAYYLYALMDGGALAGLALFLFNMESSIGLIVYIVCTLVKRRFREEFNGKKAEDEDTGETDEEMEAGTVIEADEAEQDVVKDSFE